MPRERLLPLPLDTPKLLVPPEESGQGGGGGEADEGKRSWCYQLTLVDARHCPGAVMVVVEAVALSPSPSLPFSLPPPVLHTGDFRWDRAAMTRNETLRRIRGARGLTLVLDSTCCCRVPGRRGRDSSSFSSSSSSPLSSHYFPSFPPREEAISFATRAVAAEAFRGDNKTLFLFGSHGTGEEELILTVALDSKKRVWASRNKRIAWRALAEAGALEQRLVDTVLTEEEVDAVSTDGGGGRGFNGGREREGRRKVAAEIHVVPMSCATLQGAERVLSHFAKKNSSFEAAVVFRPTGLVAAAAANPSDPASRSTKKKRQIKNSGGGGGKRTAKGRAVLYELPYSEHSCFEELVDCVRWMRPERIVPSVGARFGPAATAGATAGAGGGGAAGAARGPPVAAGGGGGEEEGEGLCSWGKGIIRALREAVAAADAADAAKAASAGGGPAAG